MKCPECQAENPDTQKFCGECGTKLERVCPNCSANNPSQYKFCGECGFDLKKAKEASPGDDLDQKSSIPESAGHAIPTTPMAIEGERKYVTALFSDMSGYTAMSEKLDPEEVKEITSRIFAEISKIVEKYDGFIEKFIGDAVMALFGVPKTHEDDPVRTIKAAKEIHDVVKAISPELKEKIGKPLSMHTGINTGLVVTGEINMEKGTHGVAGDTINVAARLSNLAEADQIIVGPDTYHQAEGYFVFEALEPTKVKGKAEPIRIFRVLSPKEQPSTTHRYHGLRADLIGREVELAQLRESAEKLREGKGSVFAICGETGIGKTRLVEEFKGALDLNEIQWLDGQAYAYSQNIPYFPLIDLLNRGFQIKEGDSPEKVKEKIESGVESLVGKREDVIPYLGSLYSLSYPEIEEVSPEFWKSRLQEAVHAILSGLAQRGTTIICLEDLHWTDSSFMDLLRFVLSEFRYPALFICVYRPTINLFTSHQLSSLKAQYQEIQLNDLSLSEAQVMLESLLKAKDIPKDLWRFIQENVGGNPLYLEEVINALIDSETLTSNNGSWSLDRPISQIDMPSTIHGIIAARLDHLENESKRVLQEASVIGRAFLYDILKSCTQLKEQLDRHLTGLERIGLIHARSLQPDLEYVFKNALTQEVVYNGLLKKERKAIHERIALVMEELFQDRLSEFYEALAFHFKQGRSIHKAVDYLIKAGEKSLARYAVEESHQYFREAFELLTNIPERTTDEDELLIGLLNKWSLVFYYRGDFKEQLDLLLAHRGLADSLNDKEKTGMFYAWLGFAHSFREKLNESYEYLLKAIELGERIGNQQIIGYACAWLTWTCLWLGRLDEGIQFGERAQEIVKLYPSDHYLYFKSLGGMAYTYSVKGDIKKALEMGNQLLDYGKKYSNIRSMTLGHYVKGFAYLFDWDFESAITCGEEAIRISADPFYTQFAIILLGIALTLNEQFQEAEDALQKNVSYSQSCGCEIIGTSASGMLGLISITKGKMSEGLKRLENALKAFYENHNKIFIIEYERTLAVVYYQVVAKTSPVSFSTMAKNVGFILKNVPSAGKKAEEHFKKAIETGKEIGAMTLVGTALYELGLLHIAIKKSDKARICLTEAIEVLEQCGSEGGLKLAKEAMASLGE